MPTTAFIEHAHAQNSADVDIVLITVTHDDLPETLRFACNNVNIVSRGETFIGYAFAYTPPGSGEGGSRFASIELDNISRKITKAIRPLRGEVTMLIETVLASDFDTVEIVFAPFRLATASWDDKTVQAALSHSLGHDEPINADSFSPSAFPALHS